MAAAVVLLVTLCLRTSPLAAPAASAGSAGASVVSLGGAGASPASEPSPAQVKAGHAAMLGSNWRHLRTAPPGPGDNLCVAESDGPFGLLTVEPPWPPGRQTGGQPPGASAGCRSPPPANSVA